MVTASEIYQQLVKFLAGEQTLDSFHAWLAANTWDIPSDSSPWKLAGRIELALAEYSNNHLSRQDLRGRLLDIASVQRVGTQEVATTSTAAAVVRVPAGAQAA
jgi:hypothetical protein